MLTYITQLLNSALEGFDETFKDTPAHQIVFATAALYFLWQQYPAIAQAYRARNNTTYKQRVIDTAYSLGKNLPQVKAYLDKELNKDLQSTKEKLKELRSQMALQDKIPEESVSPVLILKEFGINPEECFFNFGEVQNDDKARQFTVQQGDGQDSGALYAVHPQELTELLKEVYAKTALTNPLHDKWPRIIAMQAEIIRWCQELFGGSKESYGLITHGGSTSIIEAMAAYVIHARAKGIKYPEIVVPETAHAAFKKAADLTGARLITVPVDPKTGAVTASDMRKYISSNTAVIVGSAPSFMNGIHDPISELGQLAQEKGVPFHVDACLGGFLTAFLDTSKNPMDFRVKGVTSISADLHKYGCCPKGTSVCLFSDDSPALSVYAALNWSGGLYTTPGILDGSTSGARVAEIYATLSYYGHKKYQEISESIIAMRQRLQDRVEQLSKPNESGKKDIYIFGTPQWSILGFRSDTLNSHFIADELEKRGWKLNLLQKPDGFHLCLTHVHTLVEHFEDKFISDLQESIAAVKKYPEDKKPTGNVKVYGTIGILPTAVQEMVCRQYQKTRLYYEATCSKLGLFSASKKQEEEMDKPEIKNALNY
ncbi:pyridoxal phosphate-dependent decarboxylase family protein [Legionella bozemanae]|uniref:Sphingosine-1-phosphate lyase I n=1 Tax=Legionella bozemanae TaxID=447 RepID=A0A0W0RJ10_LEGBO|nr:aminotransferase class V-fold PLP-dependent enzyme [Legionella bozemanae]KTC71038.1 sphingosine-1-phosphate lyase I [Legionella bozemanae]STO34690.1 Glutamate decarboxylase [Legionella bozemanae]